MNQLIIGYVGGMMCLKLTAFEADTTRKNVWKIKSKLRMTRLNLARNKKKSRWQICVKNVFYRKINFTNNLFGKIFTVAIINEYSLHLSSYGILQT